MEMLLNWNSNLKTDDDMKKILYPILAMTVILAGCTKNEINAPTSVQTDAPEYVTASFEPMTKATLDGYSVIWNTKDEISVYAKSAAQQKYVYNTYVNDNDKTLATFKYDLTYSESSEVLTKNYAVFPYRPNDNKVAESGVVTTRIKNNQDYRAEKLLMSAPMVAVSDGYDFEFKNVASVLRFNVKTSADYKGTCTLKTIKLESKTKSLSGLVTVDTKADEWVATPIETSRNVKLQDGSINVELTNEAQPFCLVIPAGTYPADDLTITLTLNDGKDDFQKVLVYNQELTIGANKLQDINCTIKPVEVEGIVVTTGGIYEFNGHPHLTCHTASVVGYYQGAIEGVTVTEIGVLHKRSGKLTDNITIESVGSNNVKQVKASSVSDEVVIKISDLVGGGDGSNKYVYRYYAMLSNGDVVYGQLKEFNTDVPSFVEVKAGTFRMGADSGENGYHKDYGTSPAHNVTITKDFEIGKYEVTVPEFVKFLNECTKIEVGTNSSTTLTAVIDVNGNKRIVYNGTKITTSGSEEDIALTCTDGTWASSRKKLPIQRVTKWGADQYCQWLTETLNDGYTYRLPTEAEWEYAARGGNQSKGYKYSGSNSSNDVAKNKASDKSGYNSIARIGERYANELGIYDMSGNIYEFVQDRSDYNWLDSEGNAVLYFEYCKEGVSDPTGPSKANGYNFKDNTYYSIQKGGSSNEGSGSAAFCPGYRNNGRRNETYHHVCGGFRVVRVKN